MEIFNTWTVLGVISLILLIVFWGKRNAVWGGFTTGIVLGLVFALLLVFGGNEFDWYVIGKGAIFGTIAGFSAELLGKVSDKMSGKR